MIIGSRKLTLKEGDATRPVEIRLYAPERGDADWTCRFEIDWPNDRKSGTVAGFDSIQALNLTLRIIGAEIYGSPQHKTGGLSWEHPGKGYGFPVPLAMRDLLVGDDKKFES